MDYIRARLGSMHETDATPLLASVVYMSQLGKVSQSHFWKLLGGRAKKTLYCNLAKGRQHVTLN